MSQILSTYDGLITIEILYYFIFNLRNVEGLHIELQFSAEMFWKPDFVVFCYFEIYKVLPCLLLTLE